MELLFLRQKRYTEDDFCTAGLWNDQSYIISYDTYNFRTCNLRKHFPNITIDSTSMLYRKIISNNFILKDKYKKYINEKWPTLRNSYVGSHVRTWGYFRDFKDFIDEKRFETRINTFNLEKVIKMVVGLANTYKKQLFFSSESIKLKGIIKEKIEKAGFIFLSNMIDVTHSRVSNATLGLDIVIDMEILSNASALVLSLESTFSQTIFFKNENCLQHKCRIVSNLKKYLYS